MTEGKKGTTTIGIVYKDGVILAADRRASMGHLVANVLPKILEVTPWIALTTAGSVSDAQMLHKYLKAELNLYRLERDKEPTLDAASNLLANIIYSGAKGFFPYLVYLLMGGKAEDGSFKLFSLFMDGSSLSETYVAAGSGMELAYGVLESEYKKDLPEAAAVELAIKAVHTATKRDIFSGNGIDVVRINKDGVKWVKDIEITSVLKTVDKK